ncbi:hypothetical protein XFF6990_90186 [Xanthomonas citri pv. fuscans]|nr:hypothetical protein XFF6990_90186 [Xanthomonas citri pv. fuscans]
MPKGLISALCYYSRPIDAGAIVLGAENALFLADSSALVRDAHAPVRSTCPSTATVSRTPRVTQHLKQHDASDARFLYRIKTAAPAPGDRWPTVVSHSQHRASASRSDTMLHAIRLHPAPITDLADPHAFAV